MERPKRDWGAASDRPIRNLGGPAGTGPAAAVPVGLRYGMRAFRHRDFRIFFLGAMASNSGNWLQTLAVPFVLFELTGRSIWVGLAGFAQFLPSFLFGPWGGALADRMNRRTLLIVAQSAMAATAFALFAVWELDWRNRYLILAITALSGVFSGLMVPSWQAFVPSLVPKADLASAITLNSTQFNAARAIGPALAGLLLATAGPGLAFLLNAVSFLAVIVALVMVRQAGGDERSARQPGGLVAEFGAALGYIRRRTGILLSIVCAILVAFLGNPITQFTVVFADDVYESGPRVLGLLAAAIGIGAVLAAPALSTFDTRVPRSVIVRAGLPLYATAIIGFGLAPTWPVGVAALLVAGGGFLAVIASTNTSIQLIVADDMRGRVMSVRIMGFTLAFPLGALTQGILADAIGPQVTVTLAGSVLLAAAIFLAAKPALLATLDAEDDSADRLVS